MKHLILNEDEVTCVFVDDGKTDFRIYKLNFHTQGNLAEPIMVTKNIVPDLDTKRHSYANPDFTLSADGNSIMADYHDTRSSHESILQFNLISTER